VLNMASNLQQCLLRISVKDEDLVSHADVFVLPHVLVVRKVVGPVWLLLESCSQWGDITLICCGSIAKKQHGLGFMFCDILPLSG
jgi:hypothetical protein